MVCVVQRGLVFSFLVSDESKNFGGRGVVSGGRDGGRQDY